MYYSISGTLIHSELNLSVVEAGGVGYACHTSTTTQGKLKNGEKVTLYTYLHLREDVMELFGFSSREELKAFKQLLSVSGVGPKAALSILSVNTPERLALALISGDEKAISAANGVGKRIAQRVILELKDKMMPGAAQSGVSVNEAFTGVQMNKTAEAQAALVMLGYSPTEAAMVIKNLDTETLTLEDLIRGALKALNKL